MIAPSHYLKIRDTMIRAIAAGKTCLRHMKKYVVFIIICYMGSNIRITV